jgi:hypothetical protein
MPTARPRHTITETDEVAEALDAARKRWPDEGRPTRLLLRLVREGYGAITNEAGRTTARRRNAVRETSGALTGSYGPDYLERLRGDWPR